MFNNFEVTIGIEVHTVLNTKTKMFSKALNSHNQTPNTLVSFVDISLPGLLPTINKQAINKALILADALNMTINYKNIQFDRKSYFYPDLPQGFQITQQFFPIGTNGTIEILTDDNKLKKININRIHMEEDTAKQLIENGQRLMDYNRCGDPLIEIVSEPCITSADEAVKYLEALKRILIFKNISDAKMEDGSLRADINISIKPRGQKAYGTRIEIKNINSINNVAKAINYEIKRQIGALTCNQPLNQETRRYDDAKEQTIYMRDKSNTVEYRYMSEPNIMKISLSDTYVKNILDNANPSPNEITRILLKAGLTEQKINLLLDNYDLCNLFLNLINDYKIATDLAYNWLTVELMGHMNKLNLSWNQFHENYRDAFIELLKLLNDQEINNKQAKILLDQILVNNKFDIKKLIKELGFEQIKDKKVLLPIIDKYIQQNPDLIKQYNDRAERVEKFIVGMVMKETNSQANPVITMNLVREQINNFLK